jgi:hypothetical protein
MLPPQREQQRMQPENRARLIIDRQVADAGWQVQDLNPRLQTQPDAIGSMQTAIDKALVRCVVQLHKQTRGGALG